MPTFYAPLRTSASARKGRRTYPSRKAADSAGRGKRHCFGGRRMNGKSDVLRSVNGTASKCKTFVATATEECCPAIGTLAGHFTRRLSPSPMPRKRIQQQRAYLPLKRSSPRPQFYRAFPQANLPRG